LTASAPTYSEGGIGGRSAAIAILSDVLRKRRPLDAVCETVLAAARLSARDAGFARAIAGETLRRFGQLDALIRHFVPKPPAPHRAGATPEILLAGACELLFLNVAPHAAVDSANALCRRDKDATHFRPLVNAVLRRIAREGQGVLATQDAARLNTADWLWQRWCEFYGEDTTRAIAGAHVSPPPLDLTVKEPGTFAGGTALFGNSVRLSQSVRVDTLPGFAEGHWWVQDAAASLPAHLLGDVKDAAVIDLCAAPGGKTAQLARMGAHVTAVDLSTERMARVRENLARLQLDAELVEADVLDFHPATPAPFVLLDAPCSATGTIRRHPELPWIKQAADVMQCAASARDLLDAAADMVAPGGTLVFAVCSLEAEEGPEQIETFLDTHPEFVRKTITAPDVFGHGEFLTAAGDLRTLPCHLGAQGGMDGFYTARLIRL
jgi:16S rRNA (cytosine967-C5)-methyltransferase